MIETRPLFIVNPAAGNGRAAKAMARLPEAFQGPAEIAQTAGPGDAVQLATRGAAEGFAPIVAVGGDGTVQEVVHGLMQSGEPPPLGIVAVGSGNDTVRTLRLPKDPVVAARLAWSQTGDVIDVGTCNGRHFLNVAGVGLDTKVALAVNAKAGRLARGKLGYIGQALVELMRYDNTELTIHLDDEVVRTRSLLVAVANCRYFAGGMKVAPNANPADGLLEVCIGGDLTHAEALMLMPTIFVGQHGRHRKVSFHRARQVRIDGLAGFDVQLDGEILEALPAEFGLRPGALRIAGWRASTPQAAPLHSKATSRGG